jgi:hypothetical protein
MGAGYLPEFDGVASGNPSIFPQSVNMGLFALSEGLFLTHPLRNNSLIYNENEQNSR